MSMVRCKACGKNYRYEENGCCPSCGAYNRPPRREMVEADGTVHHLDNRAASTGRMPSGEGKVCFEEKTCYEEQARFGRTGRTHQRPRREGGQSAAVKLVIIVILVIAALAIASVVRGIIVSAAWNHTQNTPDYSWDEDWNTDGWGDEDWSNWDEGNRGPDANQQPVWPGDADDENWSDTDDWQNFFDWSWGTSEGMPT